VSHSIVAEFIGVRSRPGIHFGVSGKRPLILNHQVLIEQFARLPSYLRKAAALVHGPRSSEEGMLIGLHPSSGITRSGESPQDLAYLQLAISFAPVLRQDAIVTQDT
jgi:hypothetical protein